MANYGEIDVFLDSILAEQGEYGPVKCLKVWDIGSPKWKKGAMILFGELLLYPLSQVAEYLRRDRQIDYYIDHIALLQSPEMVKKEEVFHALRAFRTNNEVAVQRVLCRIYKDNEVWDTLDSAIKGNNLRLFEEQVGGDDRLQDLKKITCHYTSIVEGAVPLYCTDGELYLVEYEGSCNDTPNASSLEDMKQIAKEILSICAKLMLSAKEESYIRQICNNTIIKDTLSFDGWEYYSEVIGQEMTIQKVQPKSNETAFEKMIDPNLSDAEKNELMGKLTIFFTSGAKGKRVSLLIQALIRLKYLYNFASRKAIYTAIREHFNCCIGVDSGIDKYWYKDENEAAIEDQMQKYKVKK